MAAMLECAAAGADIIDLAVDSMSGVTSQPCMGAVVAALEGSENDLGIAFDNVQLLNTYWEQVRLLYKCFDPQVNSPASDVYEHEMPGGQYTNLMFQAHSLGLGTQWQEIKKAYTVANRLCGDIVKVTPSSKVVGDFAQFIVSNKLSEAEVLEKAQTLDFPKSVVEYFQGHLGQPPYGFNEVLRMKIIRNLPRIEGRPGASMPPMDFVALRKQLIATHGENIRDVDVCSAALYPAVFKDYRALTDKYGDLSILPTRYLLSPLKIGEEVFIALEPGKILIVKLLAVGTVNPNGDRDVFFKLNGESRVLTIADSRAVAVDHKKRPKVDPSIPGEVGAPMSGVVVEIRTKVGAALKVGDPICILSAMKMETVVSSPVSGKVKELLVVQNDSLTSGDLVCRIE